MPAKVGIHIHGPVFMDTGFRRHDIEVESDLSLPMPLYAVAATRLPLPATR